MRLCRVEPVVLRDKTEVNSLAFSPDGERLASAGGDGAVKVWNSKTGKVIQTSPTRTPTLSFSVAFHPDGKHLASVGADQQVKVWDLTTDQEVFAGPCDAVHNVGTAYAVAFSPGDGRQLAAGSDGAVKVWDWRSRQLLHTFPGHAKPRAISVAFSRDGRRLASGSGPGSVKLWDPEAGGEPLRTFPESRVPSPRWRSARTAGGWPRPASAAAWTCGIRRPASCSTRSRIADSFWASPSARTAGASPRLAKTRSCTSGTRRPAGRCSACADTPACAGAWRSARTAGASPRPAWTGPSASGTRPRSRVTRGRKP